MTTTAVPWCVTRFCLLFHRCIVMVPQSTMVEIICYWPTFRVRIVSVFTDHVHTYLCRCSLRSTIDSRPATGTTTRHFPIAIHAHRTSSRSSFDAIAFPRHLSRMVWWFGTASTHRREYPGLQLSTSVEVYGHHDTRTHTISFRWCLNLRQRTVADQRISHRPRILSTNRWYVSAPRRLSDLIF